MSLIKKNNNSRTMVFIDIRNIIFASRSECNGSYKIDFTEMTNLLVGERNLLGAYVFDGIGTSKNEDSSEKFHKCLEYDGFRVVTRNSFEDNEGKQKEVDVAMTCEIVSHAYKDNYDVAIIVSGDRDFVPAIEHIQSLGKVVEVASFDKSGSSHIKRAADIYHSLSELPIMCLDGLEQPVLEDDPLPDNNFTDAFTEVQ